MNCYYSIASQWHTHNNTTKLFNKNDTVFSRVSIISGSIQCADSKVTVLTLLRNIDTRVSS